MAATEAPTALLAKPNKQFVGFIFCGAKQGDDICYGALVAQRSDLGRLPVPSEAIGHYLCEAKSIDAPVAEGAIIARCFYRGKVVSRWDRVRVLNEACGEKGTPVEPGGSYLMIEGCNAEPLRDYDNVLV